MQNGQEIRRFILAHAARYPLLGIDDLLKVLYQSAFGCGHFAPGLAQVLSYLEGELAQAQSNPDEEITEPILGKYSRVHIAPCAKTGLHNVTLARLFMLTADEAPTEDASAWFDTALDALQELADGGKLPFSGESVRERLDAYRAAGCPSLHHCAAFREAYRPAYRVIRSDYAQMLNIFASIDKLLAERERVIIAIDGSSGAGKSTLANLLAKVYDGATVVHMDDFFLQMYQRTQERFATPGGNVDHERFLEEVLSPMQRGEAFAYRPFDCSRMEIGAGRNMKPGKLCIVEGSYSLHPALEGAYDLRLRLCISLAAQVERILARNGARMLGRFVNEWIPMENLYFEKTQIDRRCDFLIGVKPVENDLARYDVQRGRGCR